PYGPGELPNPTIPSGEPRPDWYFLPAFALVALCPLDWENFVVMGLPGIAVFALLAVPFVDRKGERHMSRRPIAVSIVIVMAVAVRVVGWDGVTAPWSPERNAWSGARVRAEMLHGRSPRELQGAGVLQVKNCRCCHALDGEGGHRGPDLAGVGARLS